MVRLYCEHADGDAMQRILAETEARLQDFVTKSG
jgi:hypothetical protein